MGATVRVRSWDELVNDHLTKSGKGGIPFADSMKKYCGNTYKIIKRLNDPFLVCLENCYNDFGFGGHWFFTPEMLDYVAPERVVQPKATEPEPAVKAPTEEKPTDAERIAHLESQVKYLTKKLAASDRKRDRLARRLRAKWESARDGEMATEEELANKKSQYFAKLKESLAIQARNGNWNYSEYMRGMYNGMEFAVAIMEGRAPSYRDAPAKYKNGI